MEFLQEIQDIGILDTVKNASYLFLGMLVGYGFWEFCECYAKVGISRINPFLYPFMVVWGASGFFFLPYVEYAHLSYYAVPDWDIPLTVWMQLEFLQHRSWLFSSVLIPLAFLAIAQLLQNTRQRHSKRINKVFKIFIGSLKDISLGLSVGISAHLMGDFLLQWIRSGDTSINIFGWTKLYSLIWLALNLLLGLIVPFLIIRKTK
ncbi:hypothetical protein [Nostoc sp. LEGE 12450]|uniref:hypothetical protein n=1 Tax=Nostoc sp. LEGE 12450 TaxID=1828643 RepID=UPI00187F0564|nr:hypothetical protein [Nostoc sp. LEGE 12450]MBE8990046.1 hypothetical protein [Nostoc sp. LEGE 12450]